MSEFTDQRDRDVRVLIDYDNSNPYVMTIRELMERAWELGAAFQPKKGSANDDTD